MYTFWQVVAGTPWWVYCFFIILISASLEARKPRFVSFNQLLITPVTMITIYFLALYYLIEFSTAHVLMWCCMMTIGIVIGWLQCKSLGLQAVRDSKRFYVPGSSIFLIITLILLGFGIYAARLYILNGLDIEFTPALFHQAKYAAWLVLAYGLFTGMYLGRLLYANHCLRVGPFFVANTVTTSH